MIRKGDKLYCIKSISLYEVGKLYEVDSITDEKISICVSIDSCNFSVLGFLLSDISKYFITLKELRKLKLNNLDD